MQLFCDENGQPDPNGQYHIIDGRVCLRDGGYARFSMSACRDSAPTQSRAFFNDAPLFVTDAQIAGFRDSAEGQEYLAYLRSLPANSHPTAVAMTADAETAAIRQHLAPRSHSIIDQATMAAARQREANAFNAQDYNAWRKG